MAHTQQELINVYRINEAMGKRDMAPEAQGLPQEEHGRGQPQNIDQLAAYWHPTTVLLLVRESLLEGGSY